MMTSEKEEEEQRIKEREKGENIKTDLEKEERKMESVSRKRKVDEEGV